MITLKNITLRNFLSIGQVTQAVDFDRQDLTLILGENLDLGGDGARNGTGKTSLIQGLSYALFGVPINSIRKDNLVNRTNGKGMLVTLEFSVNGIDYKIERGRKPNLLKFYVNNDLQKGLDDAQGENKLLSEKAESIKILLKETKDSIQGEEFKVKAIEEANKRVKEQIESLKRRQGLWQKKHESDLAYLVAQYDELAKVDIEKELLAHKELIIYNQQKKAQDEYNALVARSTAWQQKHDTDISIAHKAYLLKNEYDIESELKSWSDLKEWLNDESSQKTIATAIDNQTKSIAKENKLIEKLVRELKELEEHKCYACGQDFHDDKHLEVTTEKTTLLENARIELAELEAQLAIDKALVKELGSKPTPSYKTEAEAIRHSGDVANLKKVWEDKKQESNPFSEQLSELTPIVLGPQPVTHYDTEVEAVKHSSQVANILVQIENKSTENDPYSEQVVEMENNALQSIDFDAINRLTKTMEHQKFLLDILTSKDSFVRKKIIDQNLSYLNSRLTHYLDKIGLPHQVIFQNDLQVEITELGRELDFDNLSRGERNRLILGLSFAFRDVWENLYAPINTLFIDELIDSGLDTMGVENSIAILKDMSRRRHKSIWLVSHREELAGRVPSVLKVVKENGFTSYNTAVDME